MKHILLTVLALCALAGGLNAQAPQRVPAAPYPIVREQPNGETVTILMRGDERMHWMMTEDGWQILETKRGWYKYAKMNRKGQVVTSNRRAHDAEKRTKCEKKWLEKHGIRK